MELGEPEAIGLLHDHDRRVGDVDPDLDDGRRDEHVQLAAGERLHDGAALGRRKLAVQAADPELAELGARAAARPRASAARASIASDGETSGQTTYACRPSARWRRSRVYASRAALVARPSA